MSLRRPKRVAGRQCALGNDAGWLFVEYSGYSWDIMHALFCHSPCTIRLVCVDRFLFCKSKEFSFAFPPRRENAHELWFLLRSLFVFRNEYVSNFCALCGRQGSRQAISVRKVAAGCPRPGRREAKLLNMHKPPSRKSRLHRPLIIQPDRRSATSGHVWVAAGCELVVSCQGIERERERERPSNWFSPIHLVSNQALCRFLWFVIFHKKSF